MGETRESTKDPADSSGELSPAGEAFAEFIRAREAGEPLDFDTFCAARPEVHEDLRRLHDRWLALDRALDELGQGDASESGGAVDTPRASTETSVSSLLSTLNRSRAGDDRYAREREIARGGMGAIYRVWDRHLRRRLAMKVLLRGEGGGPEPRALSRFLEEAQITGQLEHPGIVSVHELGLDADGRVYFTMPLVRGKNLLDIIAEVHAGSREWTQTRVLGVIQKVCEAMGYAHSRGVLHRDLKPSNVMVGKFGEAYVMDWGLARVLGEEDRRDIRVVPEAAEASTEMQTVRRDTADETPESPLVTMDGDVVGTPVYMSPEQAHGWVDRMGPASDVYAIGAMLYHLLTGQRPYLPPGSKQPASEVLRALKTHAPRPVHEIARVPAELEAICDKAMDRDPARRYGNTMLMAADLRAFLEMRVVSAYETGALAEARKWVRRNHKLAVASALAGLFLVAGFATSTTLFIQAKEKERFATTQQGIAEDKAEEALTQKARADTAAQRLAAELRRSTIMRARLLARTGATLPAEDLLWQQHLLDPSDRHSYWALWEFYERHASLAQWNSRHGVRAVPVCFVSNELLVTSGEDGWIRTWDVKSQELVREVQAHEGRCDRLDVRNDTLLSSGRGDGRVIVWRLPELSPMGELDAHPRGTMSARFHPDGERILTSGRDGFVREWSFPDLSPIRAFDAGEGPCLDAVYDPDGDGIAFGTAAGNVHYWPAGEPAPTKSWQVHARYASCLTFAEGGERLVSGGFDHYIRSWRVDEEQAPEAGRGTNGTVRALAVLSDRSTLVSGGWYRLDFSDLSGDEPLFSYNLPVGVHRIAESPDGRVLAAAGEGRVGLWERRPAGGRLRIQSPLGASVPTFSPDGRTVVTGDSAGNVRIRSASTGEELRGFQAHDGPIDAMEFSVEGSVLATAGRDGKIHVRHLASDSILATFDGVDTVTGGRCMDLSPDATRLAYVVRGSEFRIVDVANNEELTRVSTRSDASQSLSVAFVSDGFVSLSRDRLIRFWSLDGEELERIALGPSVAYWAVVASPDQSCLAVTTWQDTIEIVDPASRRIVRTLEGHGGTVFNAAFHPTDPDLLASCAHDNSIRLWDISTGQNLATLDVSGEFEMGGASHVTFSPDGRTIAVSSGRSESVLMWDLDYYDRHVAGNLRHQIERHADGLGVAVDVEALEAWADEVLARPWPRLSFGPR